MKIAKVSEKNSKTIFTGHFSSKKFGYILREDELLAFFDAKNNDWISFGDPELGQFLACMDIYRMAMFSD